MRSRWYYIRPVRLIGGTLGLLVAFGYFFLDSGNDFLEILIDMYCPGFAIFLIWAIPFDIWVAKAFSSKYEDPAERQFAFRSVVRFDLVVWFALLATWGRFFYAIMTG